MSETEECQHSVRCNSLVLYWGCLSLSPWYARPRRRGAVLSICLCSCPLRPSHPQTCSICTKPGVCTHHQFCLSSVFQNNFSSFSSITLVLVISCINLLFSWLPLFLPTLMGFTVTTASASSLLSFLVSATFPCCFAFCSH